jgi:hypothetical protein
MLPILLHRSSQVLLYSQILTAHVFLITTVPCCYTEVPAYYSTKTVEYYTEAPKYYSAPIYTTTTEAAKYYAVPTYFTEAALSYYIERKYYSDAPFYFTTTYATPSYNTAAPSTTPKKPPITQPHTLPGIPHRGI